MENKNKKSIVIGITSLLLVTLILLGLTYAYYRTRIVGNTNEKSVSVDTKKYEVTYLDGDATLSTEGNIEPGFKYEKEFTVTNTGSESVKYSIILDNIENTYTRDSDWIYTLTKNETQIATGTIAVGTHQVLIGSETLESGSQTYKLTVIYVNSDENQSEDMGENMSFRVNISDESQTWENAGEGTLLYAIKNSTKNIDGKSVSMVVSTPTSSPGRVATVESEAEIVSTEDDYGTSYYYRGNVENNYVNYSGMCWRIVRVQGDGTIKLTLADESGECNAETYSTSNTTSAFVDGKTNIAYISNPSYITSDYLFEDSNIPEILSSWSENKNLDTSKLVETEWCNDTSKISSDGNVTYYSAYSRLTNPSVANPTLKCNTNGMDGTEGIEAASQRYRNKLGILSADEVAFAGGVAYQYGSYFLQANANGNWYWTMSPCTLDFTNSASRMWFVYLTGSLTYVNLNQSHGSVRPAVVLNSNVIIADGNGTQTNPYVIS